MQSVNESGWVDGLVLNFRENLLIETLFALKEFEQLLRMTSDTNYILYFKFCIVVLIVKWELSLQETLHTQIGHRKIVLLKAITSITFYFSTVIFYSKSSRNEIFRMKCKFSKCFVSKNPHYITVSSLVPSLCIKSLFCHALLWVAGLWNISFNTKLKFLRNFREQIAAGYPKSKFWHSNIYIHTHSMSRYFIHL